MSCKLFVANFPYTTTNEELGSLFGSHGEVVSVKIATDRETGRSRGFGFVEMGSQDAADAAIRELGGCKRGGRPLAVRVSEERERPSRGPGGPRGGGGGFGGPRGGGGGGGAPGRLRGGRGRRRGRPARRWRRLRRPRRLRRRWWRRLRRRPWRWRRLRRPRRPGRSPRA